MYFQKKKNRTPHPILNPPEDKDTTPDSWTPYPATVTGLEFLGPGSGFITRLPAWPTVCEYRPPTAPQGDIGTSFLLLITHHDRLTEEPPHTSNCLWAQVQNIKHSGKIIQEQLVP